MAQKVFIKTHGCQMNEYDSARMFDLLHENRDMERVDTPEEADLLLLNTCSIREKAQEKVKTRHEDRRGWLCCQPGRRNDRQTGALCRCGLWSTDPASPAGTAGCLGR